MFISLLSEQHFLRCHRSVVLLVVATQHIGLILCNHQNQEHLNENDVILISVGHNNLYQ